MNKENNDPKTNKAEIKKQNQDLPNIPASSEKIKSGETAEKEIKETSILHKDGKTDNTDQSEN